MFIQGVRCEHTFCDECIEIWIKENSSCPVCRIKTRIVLNLLDRLSVRCKHCHEENIKRGDFVGHTKYRCRYVIVKYPAVNLDCSWTGKREEQTEHLAICSLVKVQPIIEKLHAFVFANTSNAYMKV
ncbi:hypothetical protein I4U23_006002 [Adineta vaga]|nr:hypothetical protein I4U23_006002 [Adineta vaga]